MGTKQFSNYDDLLTFTRASKGHALRPVSYGSELVTNGTYDTDLSGWATASGYASFTQSSGQATGTSNGSSAPQLNQSISTTVGSIYQVKYELVSSTSAGARFRVGTTDTGNQVFEEVVGTTTGARTKYIVATATTTYISIGYGPSTNGLTQTFDNISVKEVLFDQPDGTLTLFEHPDDVPRVEWDSAGSRLGLLVEEARTNKFVYSEAFNETNWQRPNDSYAASTLPFTEQSPTKVSNSAATLVDDSSGGTGGVYIRALVSGLTNSTPHTFSVFAKKDQLSYLALETKFFTVSTATVYFDLDAGTVGTATNCTGAIQAYPDGWYRCSLTFTTDASDTSGYGNIFVAEGDGDKIVDRDGTSSIFIFGAQFEEGSFPTSYMKNEGTASGKDRSADVASIPVADFGYNQSAGTLFAVAQNIAGNTTDPRVVTLSDGTSDNRIRIDVNDGNNIRMTVTDGGVSQTSTQNTFNDYDSQYKVAFAFKENDFKLLVNNSITLTDSSGTVPDDITTVYIGSNFNGAGGHINGHIKSFKYYPRRLTNAQLEDITS